jgi:hypothetical protein
MYRARDAMLALVARRRHMTNTGLHREDTAAGEVGEGILVSTAAVAAEHLEHASLTGANGGLLDDPPVVSRTGAGVVPPDVSGPSTTP